MSRHNRRNGPDRRLLAVLVLLLAVAGVLSVIVLNSIGRPAKHSAAITSSPGTVIVQQSQQPSGTNSANSKPTVGPVVSVSADLGQIAPANSVFGLLLPASTPSAWKMVTGIGDPRTRLSDYTLPSSVAVVGYFATTDQTHAANSGWPGSEAVVLVTANHDQALALNDSLMARDGRKYVSAVSGSSVLVTELWNDPAAMAAGPRLSSVARYNTALARQPKNGSGTLWIDGHDWLANMAALSAPDVRTAFATSLAAAVPAGASTWIGSAQNDAYTYSGAWIGSIGETPAGPKVSGGPTCPPTQQVCSGLGSVTDNPGTSAATQLITVTAGANGAKTLAVALSGIQDYFGVGGQAAVQGLSVAHTPDGVIGLSFLHS